MLGVKLCLDANAWVQNTELVGACYVLRPSDLYGRGQQDTRLCCAYWYCKFAGVHQATGPDFTPVFGERLWEAVDAACAFKRHCFPLATAGPSNAGGPWGEHANT